MRLCVTPRSEELVCMFKIFTFSKVSVLIILSHAQDNLLDTHQWFEVGELFWQFVSVVQTHEMAEGWSPWILTLKPFALLFWTYICISTRYVVKSSIFLNHKHDDVIKWKYFPRYLPFVKFTGHRWIPHTKANDAELWCFLWSAPV